MSGTINNKICRVILIYVFVFFFSSGGMGAFADSAVYNGMPGTTINTTGPVDIVSDDAIGLHADLGGTINSSYDVSVSGDSSYGAYAESGGSVIISGNITVSGDGSYGAYAEAGAVDIEGNVSVSGDGSIGMIAENGGFINITGNIVVSDDQYGAQGVHASMQSDANVEGDVTVFGVNDAYGLFAERQSTISADGNVYVSGIGSTGAYAEQYSSVDIGGEVYVSGEYSTGAYAEGYSSVNIGGGVYVSGDSSQGVFLSDNSNGNINGGIVVSGEVSWGLHLTNDSHADVNGDIFVSGEGALAVGVESSSTANIFGNVIVSGDWSRAIASEWDNSMVSVVGDVYASGDYSTGAHLAGWSQADINGDIFVSGEGSKGVDAWIGSTANISGGISASGDYSTAIHSCYDSIVNVQSGIVVASGTDNVTLLVEDGGIISLDNSAAVTYMGTLVSTSSYGSIFAENGTVMSGDIINSNDYYAGDTLNVTLSGGSAVYGAANDLGAEAATNITLADLFSAWHVTDDSTINGTLENYGIVDYRTATDFKTVTTYGLGMNNATGGTFAMKADIANEKADLLKVTGETHGSYRIDINNDGAAATDGSEITLLVETADRGGNFALTHDVEAGAWRYGLRNNTTGYGTGAGWELYAKGLSGPGESALSTLMGSYLLAYAETTLIQRMGDLRSSPHLAGLWARTYGGQFEGHPSWHTPNLFDMDFWGVNIGYDRKTDISWDGDAYYGAFFGYSRGDMSYASGGSGNIDSTMIGIYGAYINPGGFYLDSVLKYRWRKSDFSTYDSMNTLVESDKVSTSGFGWSLEMGQRISFNGTPKGGWYAEPQVQLRYQRHNDGYFNLSNGLRIGTEGFTSIIGRLGILAGYETEDRNYYVKAFRLREFAGDLSIYANGSPIEEDLGGSWWVYGLGFTARVNDKNYLYLDLERTAGNDIFEQKWRLNAGWRMEF